jgi:hypothetical protein
MTDIYNVLNEDEEVIELENCDIVNLNAVIFFALLNNRKI